MIIPVILSGGSGTRLWPLSREFHPKQFLSLVTEKTMIQETVCRLNGLDVLPPVIVCGEQHSFIIAEQMQKIGIDNPSIILEPVARNTAAAIAAACFYSEKIDSNAIVIVLPSDHNIEDQKAFQDTIKIAIEEAKKGSLVTLGITPTFAATGYGYIEGEGKKLVRHIKRFVEKPNIENAEKYLESGKFLWNSGMYIFKASSFLKELKILEKEIFDNTQQSIEKAENDSAFIRLDKTSFEKNPSISIDYAVMEKTSNGKVIPLTAGWSDVGSWSSLLDISKKDSDGNSIKGEVVSIDTKNSFISSKKRLIAVIGLEDVIVVDTEDALLVTTKEKCEKVKEIVDKLKASGSPIATKYTEQQYDSPKGII